MGDFMYKYKTLMIIMFFLLVIGLSKVNASINDYSLLNKVIYLDAGHGGIDCGATSKYIIESELNLEIVKLLESELVKKGAYVLLTRNGDYDLATSSYNRKRSDLYNRAKLINDSKASLYISIHLNSTTDSRWNGIQVFYDSINVNNKDVAKVITDSMRLNMKNIRDYKKENGYYMYSKINDVPGVLIEAGFISNANDNYKLRQDNYKKILVKNISIGIDNYFNNK